MRNLSEKSIKARRGFAARVIAAIIAVIAVMLLYGCSESASVEFSVTELTLCVGDTRDLAPYAVFDPAAAEDKSFTLSTDSDSVTVDGTTVTAVTPGKATVTAAASGGSCEMAITVVYRAAQNLAITADGSLVQNGTPAEVVFSAELDDYVDPNTAIVWTVNGDKAGDGATFSFTPSGYGEYTVAASAQNLTASETVKVYRPTEASGTFDGTTQQYKNFTGVTFSASEVIDTRNPRSVYDWRINGATVSVDPTFTFCPQSRGSYVAELFVNGVKRKIDGNDSVTVSASGDRAPSCEVVFDDVPGVRVTWDDGAPVRSVAVTAPDGTRTVFSRSDARYSDKFGDGYFDATDYIQVCASVPSVYSVSVSGDAVGEPCEFTQYPLAAKEYIDNNVLCQNSFITDAAQARQWIRELYAMGVVTASGYLSREAEDAAAAKAIVDAAKDEADKLGLKISVKAEGVKLSVTFDSYVNAPISSVATSKMPIFTEIPHVEYDKTKLRPVSTLTAIERVDEAREVRTSEQLLYCVNAGYRPLLVKDSDASKVYAVARNALKSSIGADYDDERKVHAIYDWLQFCTARFESPHSSCDFLDGVFARKAEGMINAASDRGLMKAFALMCGIEGIPCEMNAVKTDDGYDFYNTVTIGGRVYNVDVFGGMAYNEKNMYDCTSHAGLFYVGGEATDFGLSHYLKKTVYDGIYCDTFVDASEYDDYKTVVAAVYAAFSSQTEDRLVIETPRGSHIFFAKDYGIEIALGDLPVGGSQRVIDTVLAAAKGFYKDAFDTELGDDDYECFVCDNVIHFRSTKPSIRDES